jgi:hypothetical protein
LLCCSERVKWRGLGFDAKQLNLLGNGKFVAIQLTGRERVGDGFVLVEGLTLSVRVPTALLKPENHGCGGYITAIVVQEP